MTHSDTEIEVYCTTYVLTKGVLKVRGRASVDGYFVSASDVIKPWDWHRTEAEALARVSYLITSGQTAIAKRAAKLEALDKLVKQGRMPMAKT